MSDPSDAVDNHSVRGGAVFLCVAVPFGDVLLYQKLRQPFIARWTLPVGKVHADDMSIMAAAEREVAEKIGGLDVVIRHAGDCYIRVLHDGEPTITTFAHVFYGAVKDGSIADHLQWVKLRELDSYDTAPGVQDIVARTLFGDEFFFEEYQVDW